MTITLGLAPEHGVASRVRVNVSKRGLPTNDGLNSSAVCGFLDPGFNFLFLNR
jgi:hypothetical protein